MSIRKYNMVVIGSGPGGYTAAIRASQLGMNTVVLEKAEIGGTCVNYGCVPTKALLESAHFFASIGKNRLGVEIPHKNKIPDSSTIAAIWDRSRKAALKSSMGITSLFKKYSVELIRDAGVFVDSHHISLTAAGEILEFDYAIIASGSLPLEKPPYESDDQIIWNYRSALLKSEIPASLGIIGGGIIGMEMADLFSSLGSKVTVYEYAPSILPFLEDFQAKGLKSHFQKEGVKIHENVRVENILKEESSAILRYRDAQDNLNNEKYDRILNATGVRPNAEALGMDKLEVATVNGFIPVDDEYRVLPHRNIFAIGDVIGGRRLAHKASREGHIAAEFATGANPATISEHEIPSVVYTRLAAAGVGRTEKELMAEKTCYKMVSFPVNALAMATAIGQNQGEMRIYYHPEKETILGAHILSPLAGEIITYFSVFMKNEIHLKEIAESIFPHPTLSEGVYEVVNAALGVSCNI